MSKCDVTSRCLCGAVQYQVLGDPAWIGHCHCLSCRRNTGAAIVTFVGFHDKDVSLMQGQPILYESSPGVRRRFCGQCGTPVSYEADRFPGEIHLYVSSFENPEQFQPQFHVYESEKIHWLKLDDSLPRHPATSDSHPDTPVSQVNR